MSCYQILDKHTILDMFCSKWTSHNISHLWLCLRCDIALRNPFSKNKSTVVCISISRYSDWMINLTSDTNSNVMSLNNNHSLTQFHSIHLICKCSLLHYFRFSLKCYNMIGYEVVT